MLSHDKKKNIFIDKMAASSAPSPPPPPPPPPPPLANDNNSSTSSVLNGSTINQPQYAVDGAKDTATNNVAKPWQRPWSVDEMRKGATSWSLASDAGLLLYLQEFSQNMIAQTHKIEQKVDGLVHDTKGISSKVHNTFNDFLMLSNTQFIENRVYDEEETKDDEVKNDETNSQEKEKTREELETEVIPKINEAIASGFAVLDSAFMTVEITPEQMSDEEEEGNLPENLRPEPILEMTDVYAHRKLPSFIGSSEFHNDDLVGLAESSSEDEKYSDNEASMGSEETQTSEDEKSSESESESETVSGSSSKSEESSTESEEEEDVVQRKKPRKESADGSDTEVDLFSASTKEKSSILEEDEETGNSEESDEDAKEKPRKSAAALDFSAELAAKLGVKARQPEISENDENDDKEWEESEKPGDEQDKEDLFSASVDTTSSVTSKGRKKKGKSKHKKSKSRSSSQASHEESGAAILPSAILPDIATLQQTSKEPGVRHNDEDEWEESGKHNEQQDDLFTSSIDTTSSVVSKTSRGSRHKHKKKRSDSQLSNASLKSDKSKKETKKISEPSPEEDLFAEEDLSSPFGKKGGMFSGGGGLFDGMDEDESKSDTMDQDSRNTTQDRDESDGEDKVVKAKPRTLSGKKLPAGAVAIFGDHGPFGPSPVHSSDQIVEKDVTITTEKKSEKTKSGGGGLFSDDGEDMFSSSQSSSVVSNKPPAKKTSKTVDLFGDDNDADDDDDDSLFAAKPAKKTEEPKSQPPKKKLPVGAVSMFGSSPPPLFNTSPTDDEPVEPIKPSSVSTIKSFPAKEGRGLFDEDDKTSSFNSEKSTTPVVVSIAVKPKHKTNQISLFDDQENNEDDGDDLFASIAPSKATNTSKNRQSAEPEQTEEPVQEKKTATSKPTSKKATISLFDDDDEEEDGDDDLDIFSAGPPLSSMKKETAAEIKPPAKSTLPKSGLFESDDHDDPFSDSKQNDQKKQEPPKNEPVVKPAKPAPAGSTLLDTEDDDHNLFTEPKTKALDPLLIKQEESTVNKTPKPKESKTTAKDMENDLFTESKKATYNPLLVESSTSTVDNTSKEDIEKTSGEDSGEQKDDEGKDEEDGFINSNNQNKIPSKKSSKNLAGAVNLFGGIDIFAGQNLGKPKRQQQGSGLFRDDEDDLFAATSPPKPVPSVAPRTKPPKKQETTTPEVTTTSPLSEAKVPIQPAKPAVSSSDKNSTVGKLQQKLAFNPAAMLPGVGPPPRKRNEISDQAASESSPKKPLVFNPAAMLPGAVPPPRKKNDVAEASFDKPADTPEVTTSSPLSEAKVPIQPAKPAVSSSDKNSTVGKLQQKLAFNPAAMLPGVGPPPRKRNEISDQAASESSPKKPLVFNPAAMLPGAVPPPRKKNDVAAEASFDKPADVKILESSSKDRVRILGKRRPPTRQARRKAAKKSMDDTALFGSDISASFPSPLSNERLDEVDGKNESLFSDSDDLFSSNSYQALDKNDGIPQVTQSKTFKPDPLLDHNKTKSSASLFEDSVDDAMSKDKIDPVVYAEKEENVPTRDKETIKTTTDSLLDDNAKDDLFSRSTEDIKPSSHKVNLADDKDDEEDLFKSNNRPLFSPPPMDFDSEASASGDFTINKNPKSSSDELVFTEDSKIEQDIFAPVSRAVTLDEKKEVQEDKKENQEKGDKKNESKLKTDGEKSNAMDDLFGDTGSIFDDIPQKTKKKKKATTSKQNIFDEPAKDSVGDEESTSVKTKKAKTKKKEKSKISIFDDDSPNIFDDPLNATSK